MVAPALIYLALRLGERDGELIGGWAIPCATDIAFSAMIARLIFPASHPAIPFLLLVAIADDAMGLVILAVFYPSGPLSLPLLAALMASAVLLALWLRRRRTRSFWPYVIGPGALSWAALYLGGFHPALALVPIVPLMPHAAARPRPVQSTGAHALRHAQHRFEHWWAMPVQIMLFFFGLANAGVPFERIGPGTWFVIAGLLFGKPIGIVLFAHAARLAGATLPGGLQTRDLFVVGVTASIGFTVSLFFATAAFPEGTALARRRWARF